ncbi:MAG: serine hydrolase domain-containing protein, partial [Pseudomonadota bacterium]
MDNETATSIRNLVDELIEDGAPGYAVGVVIDDRIVFSHYAGLANLDTPTPIDARSRFNIASVAKQFTALMILDLVESGQVDLSEDFRTYLP